MTSGPASASASSVACGERTRTASFEARRTNSSTLRSAISRPRPITIRCSAVSAISLIRCEETNTVRPSAASSLSRLRIHWIPSGSRPFAGSSRIRICGSARSAAAIPSRWPIPSENCPTRFRATSCRPTRSISSSTRLFGDAVGLRQREQVVVGRAAGVHGARLEQRADLVQRRRVARGSASRSPSPCPRSAGRGRGSAASSSTSPSRSARGSR